MQAPGNLGAQPAPHPASTALPPPGLDPEPQGEAASWAPVHPELHLVAL